MKYTTGWQQLKEESTQIKLSTMQIWCRIEASKKPISSFILSVLSFNAIASENRSLNFKILTLYSEIRIMIKQIHEKICPITELMKLGMHPKFKSPSNWNQIWEINAFFPLTNAPLHLLPWRRFYEKVNDGAYVHAHTHIYIYCEPSQ